MTLTKDHILGSLQSRLDVSHSDSSRFLGSTLELIKSSLAGGDDFLISSFGKFIVRQKAARRGRNPAAGEDLALTARQVVVFKCSAVLKEKVNGSFWDLVFFGVVVTRTIFQYCDGNQNEMRAIGAGHMASRAISHRPKTPVLIH